MAKTPSAQEIIEINKYKQPEHPNNAQDEIEAAKAAARDARNKARRVEASRITKEFNEKEIQSAIEAAGVVRKKENLPNPIETKQQEVAPTKEEPVVETKEEVVVAEAEDVVDEDQQVTRIDRNGQKVTKSLKEWLAPADKVQDADEYYNRAASHLSRATSTQPAPVAQTAPTEFKLDDAAVAAIQTGNAEEVATVLGKLQQSAVAKARAELQQAQLQERLETIQHKVEAQYPEVFKDPFLASLVNAEFNKSITPRADGTIEKIYVPGNYYGDFEARLIDQVSKIKTWHGGVKAKTESEVKKEALIAKKKQLLTVKGSNERVETTTPAPETGPFGKTFANQEEYNQFVAKQMAAKKTKKVSFAG